MAFFFLTSKHLYESWKFTKSQLNNESSIRICPRRQKANQNFKVILKLFVIMGITHFSELIGFTLSWIYGRDQVWKYFVFNDMINLLQGVLIFIVLVCKPSVLSQIWPLSFPNQKLPTTQVTQVSISNGISNWNFYLVLWSQMDSRSTFIHLVLSSHGYYPFYPKISCHKSQ